MLRHDRSRFIAYALPCFANGVGLLLYALDISTSGTSEVGFFPSVILGLICLMLIVPLCIKRGRDLDLPAAITCVLLFVLGPLTLLLIGVFTFMKSSAKADERFGPPPPPAGANVWLSSVSFIALPAILVATSSLCGF